MSLPKIVLFSAALWLPGLIASAHAQVVHTVVDEPELRSAILALNPGDSIVFNASITLTSDLPAIAQSITISGNGFTLHGADQFRGLMIAAVDSGGTPQPVSVAVEDLTIAHTVAAGGAGGDGGGGGGGGAGLGGAIFVASQANVTLSNVTVVSSQAVGGSGGLATGGDGGGGGGLGGAGGAGTVGAAGGGGGAGTLATGGTNSGAGADGILTTAFPAGSSSGGGAGGATGGGGGSGAQGGGGGGASGGGGLSGTGGTGGYGGGGGGGTAIGFAASGGLAGGGGGAVISNGGFGGYGAGGGGTADSTSGGSGGLFGGNGANAAGGSGGGGGAGLGGAIFVEGGGSLTIAGLTVNGGAVTGGTGAAAGGSYGAGLFLAGSGAVTFNVPVGETSTIADQIADETGVLGPIDVGSWFISKDGAGTLVLTGTNLYSGGTTVNAGTLQIDGSSNVGTGSISLFGTSALSVTGSSTFSQSLFIDGTPLIQVAPGQTVDWNGSIFDGEVSGQLQLGGGGTLSLTSSGNSYTGGTVVFGGSTLLVTDDTALGDPAGGVQLGDAISFGALAVGTGSAMTTTRDVVLGDGGGVFETQGTASLTVNGTVSGAGALIKDGNGTLILGGFNTYTGSTYIDAGSLRAGTSGVVSTGAMTIQFGAQFDLNGFDQTVGSLSGNGQVNLGTAMLHTGGDNSSTSFLGPIIGTGSLVKTGTGSFLLAGINTYSGGTTVDAGSLIGTTTSLQGNIVNNALVEFAQVSDGTYADVMSGSGVLVKSGAGALTLTGINTYTGGTFVDDGSLIGTTTSLQGNIVNHALVEFAQASDGTYADVMSGTGALVKSGAGALTLTGINTYSGGTFVDDGSLIGTTTSLQGNIVNNALVEFAQASDGTYADVMSGTGALVKSGAGALTLTGINTYSGGTFVDDGSLIGTTTSLQGNIVNNATVEFAQAGAGTYASVMSGAGALVKSGTGALTLSGANSYSGGTTVSAGSLIGATTSLQGNIANNATVEFAQAGAGSYTSVMSGTGALVKSGAGALTLTGINTYSGGTTVSGGSLIGTTTSLQGNIVNNATVEFAQAGAGTYAGVMNGSGGLVKSGAGALTLSGANSYSGGTTVSAGSLIGTTASVQGNIVNNATVEFTQAGAGTYAGAMSGSGSLLMSGTGALTLSGTNSYSGGTTVSTGSLIGTSASLQGNILNNTTVEFAQAGAGTYAGAMSGSGALVKSGAGALTVSGTNTYTGGTTVSAGSLIGTTTSLQGNIANNATVEFAQAGAGTYTSVMSGTGALVKSGTGALTLSGANSYSGGTTVDGGSLIGTTTSLQGNIANNATVEFTQAGAGTYAGAMSGSGALVKSGAGALTLSGANSYSGGTTVSAGSLIGTTTSLQGNIVNNATVEFAQVGAGTYAGAMSGTGSFVMSGAGALTLSGTNVYSGGTTVSAGSLIGTSTSLQGNIANNATVEFAQAGAGTYASVMSGAGALVKSGGGALTLSGINTYAGGTTVNAGSLIGTTTSLQGNIANNATVEFAQAGAGTYAGAMSGTGSFVMSGAGALTLSGTNVYTGGTTVSAGSLIGTTTSLQGNVVNNATVEFAQVGAGTYAGAMSGSGALVMSGTGALTLSGTNSYTGGTTVNAGSLIGTTTSLQGNIVNNATVEFAQVGAGTYAGAMSGSGSLLMSGTGALTLSGTNSYSGGTTVSTGSLIGTSASLQGNILNNETVEFAQAGTGTYAGAMSGTGSLTKSGAGTLTLSGASTYSGGTTVTAGTLVGTSTSLQGNISNSGTVVFDQAASGTFAGSIAGGGQVQKLGAGTLMLTGTQSYTGPTALLGGVLRAGAVNVFSPGSAMQVGAGTTLDLNGLDQTLGGLTGTGSVTLGQGSLTVGSGNTSGIFDGTISGAGALIKIGTGGLTLTGSQAYQGGTTVAGGTLIGSTISLQGNILNNATVAFDQAFAGTYAGVLSGSGTFIKSGAGALTLTGLNTYSGGTTVAAGSLIGTTASLQGNILNNALVVFDQASSGTYAGVMSGTGALVKTGTGSLTLAGPNTYSGGTTVAGGSLVGTTTSLLGHIVNNATVVFDQAFDGLFAGSMSGTGALVKSGAGTLTLGGPLSHTGGTIVTGGTVAAGATNVFGGVFSLVGDGVLAFNGFDQTIDALSGSGNIALGGAQLTTGGGGADGVFTGAITGSGSLLKVGGGTLVLSGANTYSGGTTVAGGTLFGTSTSIQGNILNNAFVAFDQSAAGAYAGSMSGSGSLAKFGSGTLTLTGANSYTGGTLISGGTLAGTASSLTGTIVNNASLLFTGDADGTFNGTLAGGGSVTKTGLGTLSLNGAHPMSGLFTVGQGTLSLAGILGGSISVQSGARLLAASPASPAGTAAMDGAQLAASSGNRITGEPLMIIAGNLSLLPGSIFSLPVGLGPVASVLVGGAAVIDGAEIAIVPLDIGNQRTTSFVALTALNGFSMTDTTVSTQNPLLLPFLRQNSNSLAVTLINLGIPLAQAASTGNGASVGTAIDGFKVDAAGDVGFIARELSALDESALDDALRLVAGEVHASSLQVAIREGESFTDMIRGELSSRDRESEGAYLGGGTSVRFWSQVGAERTNFAGVDGASGGTVNVAMGAGGVDWKFSDRWSFGAGGGFGLGSLSLKDHPASTDFKAPKAFGYAGFRPRGFGLKAGGSFSRSKSKTDRNVAFAAQAPEELGGGALTGGVNRDALAEEIALISDQWSEYDDDLDVKTYRLEWFVGLRRASFGRKGFTESGAGALSLLLPDQTFTLRQADVKVHVWRRERDVRPFFEALYRRETTSGKTKTRLEFADVPHSDFAVEGLPVPGHTFSGRAGVTLMTWLGAWTFEYQARYATGSFAHGGDVRVRFK